MIDKKCRASASKNPLESAKLDGELDAIAAYLSTQLNFIQNVSEWNINQVLPTYISTTQFSLSGDVTDIYTIYRKVRVVIGISVPVYSTVGASAYDSGTGLTTVTLLDAILAANITELAYGLINATTSQSSFPANLLNVGVAVVSTTPYSVSRHATLILCDATAGSMICNLLSYSILGPGKMYIFRKIASDTSAYTVTITPAGSEKIDGKDSVVLQQPGDTVVLMTKAGTGWELIQDRVSKLAANSLPGAFGNIKVRNNSGSPQNKIDISADYVRVRDAGGNVIDLADISHTIDFTTTGINALDAGTLTNSTWYYIHEISKADGTKAGLGSTSATAPQMPTGYTYKKLINAIYYATGAFRNIEQRNRVVDLVDTALDMTGAVDVASWTSKDITAFVPPIAVAIHLQPGSAASFSMGVAVAWDNAGAQRKQVFVAYNGGITFEGLQGAMPSFWYPLNPAAIQTLYVKSYDTNERGRFYCLGYEIAI